MNYTWLAIKKAICTICSAIIPNKTLRHKVRYALNPLNDKRVEQYFREQYVLPFVQSNHFYNNLWKNKVEDKGYEYIWQCWLQGIEQAPAIVQMCFASVEKYKKSNQRIVYITAKNYTDYVNLPTVIIEKWKKGIISAAHFADILRVNLLATYGGYWIDATCLLSAPTPSAIDSTPIFMFHSYGKFDFTLIQNCFIHAAANDYLIQAWCLLVNQFWTKERKLLHYFQHHLLFKALITIDSRAKQEFERMPVIYEKDTQALMNFILVGPPYKTQELKRLKEQAFIHKLTYKAEIPNDFITFYSSIQ